MPNIYSIILAAGQGKRMRSSLHKVLHPIGGVPMIVHIIETLQTIHSEETIVVVGHQANQVVDGLKDYDIKFAEQKEQLGTAHAVMQVYAELRDKSGITLVLNGDTPLLTKDTLLALTNEHIQKKATVTVLTTEVANPFGYGRIIRNSHGDLIKIVEEKDASSEEKTIKEINSGTYCFDNQKLFDAISKVKNDNIQGEYYLTDVIEILRSQNEVVAVFQTLDQDETIGINDRVALSKAEKIFKNRVMEHHLLNGVTIIDPDNTYIEKHVIIEQDTILYPESHLKGKTVIHSDCVVGPNVDLRDVELNKGVVISHTVANSAKIGEKATVGPYAYIRPGSIIGSAVKIGDFVEIKNTTIGNRSKVPHLSYIGDSILGEDINIGSGTITVNYDGFKKHQTVIGDRAFIGCNSNLVAPVTIGNDSYVAAGSTITEDVPEFALSIARQRQSNKTDYVKKIREKNQKDKD